MNRISVVYLIAALCAAVTPAAAENSSSAGTFLTEPATLHCLGVRWEVKGDANKNAVIDVEYRKKGENTWKKGYPLFRTFGRNISGQHNVAGGWMFAGSIVDLDSDTPYEVKCSLKDPDGGNAEKQVEMRTWKEPQEPPGMKIKHVVPGKGGGKGTEKYPYKGLDEAAKHAEPGTLFLLHKGTYVKDNCRNNTWTFGRSGEKGKPIIFRGAGDGDAVLDGGGSKNTGGRLVSACNTRHIWFEDLVIQGRQYVIVAHKGSNWVIRRCRFRNMTKGFTAHNGGYDVSRHHWISDNVFTGPTKWPRKRGIEAFASVLMSGAGHVVAYNMMQNMGDGIHGTKYGSMSASDYYNNDITICTDDGMETDECRFNMRVFRNRILNVAHGVTAQPAHGGPVYIFRNLIYNATYSPFKLNNHTNGVLILHNTCLKHANGFNIVPARETVTNLWTRNNLFLCRKGTGLNVGTPNMKNCNFDSDGYGGYGRFARWNARYHYKTIQAAKKAGKIYSAIGAVQIDPGTCFASGLMPPADRNKTYKGQEIDARLAEKSDAIDRGVVLPGFNDGYAGKAPDLGCFEYGTPLPRYGPRAPSQKD